MARFIGGAKWLRPCLDAKTFWPCLDFDKHYPIMKQLGLKDSSRDLQLNCAISYLFYLYLVFHTCAARFDVIGNLVKFWVFDVSKQGLSIYVCGDADSSHVGRSSSMSLSS